VSTRETVWCDTSASRAGLAEADYTADADYLGATVGRYANRIAGGTFVLDGQRHHLPCNEPGATLHGGSAGFDHVDFDAGPVTPSRGSATPSTCSTRRTTSRRR
jgi:galactose mutarotase-like enzyme